MTVVDPEAVAHWEAQLASALADHDDAEAALVMAKAACDEACASAQAAVADEPSEANVLTEEATHLAHKGPLDGAYARFGAVATAELNLKRARFGLPPVGANPAPAGEVTPIEANVLVSGEVAPS